MHHIQYLIFLLPVSISKTLFVVYTAKIAFFLLLKWDLESRYISCLLREVLGVLAARAGWEDACSLGWSGSSTGLEVGLSYRTLRPPAVTHFFQLSCGSQRLQNL